MRTSTAILAASTALLAVTAAYLGREVGVARAAADESARLAQYLTNRVVELERVRALSSTPSAAQPGVAPYRGAGPSGAPVTNRSGTDAASEMLAIQQQSVAARPKTSAMQRIQNSQARAGAKRMYADFAAESGLSPEESARLYQLIAQRDLGYQNEPGTDPGAVEAEWRERDRKFREQANALLGPDGTDRLDRYQNSFGARGQILDLDD